MHSQPGGPVKFAPVRRFWYTRGEMKKPPPLLLPRLALALVIAAYVALAVASSFADRLGWAPDEPAHFIYIREIGSGFRLPGLAHQVTPAIFTADGREVHISHEAHQPPLYYVLAAVPYFAATSLGAGTDTVWRILRLFTVLFGVGWVYVLYRLSREFLGRNRYAAVLAAACVALLPSSTYIGGVVNNDALTALVVTTALWLILRSLRRGKISRRAGLEIGIVSGLAMLTKAQGVFLPAVAAAAGLLIAGRKDWRTSVPTLTNTAIAILTALAVSSIWFVRNWYVFGSPVIQSLYNPVLARSVLHVLIITDQLFKYFWTPFWLIRQFVNDATYAVAILCFCAVVLVGLVAHFMACRRTGAGEIVCRFDAWLVLALPGILTYVSLIRHILLVDKLALSQGRLLLPAAGLFGIAVVVGLGALVRRPRLRSALGVLLVLGLIVANLVVLRAVVAYNRIYRPPPEMSLEDMKGRLEGYASAPCSYCCSSPAPDARLGSVTVNVLPSPSLVSTATVPPCSSTISLTMESPRPVPPS